MQAVILAGGLGTRLRPLTQTVPKVLVPVAGRPFVDWLLGTLPREIFSEVLFLLGYLGDQVRSYCGDGSRYGFAVRYSQEPEPLGTAGALRYAAEQLQESFVLLNGDTYIQVDYAALLHAHRAQGRIGTMVVVPAGLVMVPPNVQVKETGQIVKYVKGSDGEAELNATDAGVVVLEKRVLGFIPAGRKIGLEEAVFASLAAAGELAGFIMPQPFYDMGTPEGLHWATEILERK